MCEKRDFLFRFVDASVRSRILLDEEALYSTTDQVTADKITKDIAKYVELDEIITDATACAGGNTYSFAQVFRNVLAFEKDPLRSKLLKHNMTVLGVSNNVTIKCGDANQLCQLQTQKLIFIDPPWGGPDYKRNPNIELYMSDVPLWKFCKSVSPFTKYVAVKAPTNFNEVKFINDTKSFMQLIHKNVQLRKMHFYVFEVCLTAS